MNDLTNAPAAGPERVPLTRLVWGIAMLGIGVLAFVDAIDLYDTRQIWRYWPMLLIVLGLSNEIEALRTRVANGGYILLAIGVWMLAGTHEFLGLDYRTAFPLGIAVVGLAVILHALVGVEGKKKEQS